MAYKAFLVGVNTQGLQYAEQDALLMQEALQRHGYEVVLAPITKRDLLEQLEKRLDACHKTDTVLFYFSGHGLLQRGKLHLVLGEDTNKQTNILNINDITNRLESSVANNKLIILDCCHSGAVQADWHPDFHESFRVLTASERLEEAKEIEGLRASFLTYYLHQALVHRCVELVDQAHQIYLNHLYEWLLTTTQQYNATSIAPVPLPNLLGNSKANFAVATVSKTQLAIPETDEKQQYVEQTRKGIQEKRNQFERAVYRSIMEYLLKVEKNSHLSSEDNYILSEITDFLVNKISAQDLATYWKKFTANRSAAETLNYPALFENLQRGNIIIFLNNSVSQNTVAQLRHFFDTTSFDSFTEVCEFAEIQHGKNLLCAKLEEFLHPSAVLLTFHELLAQVPAPLIVISTGYDTALEQLFKERNKKYAVLSHPISPQGAKIVFVEYSDKQPPEHYEEYTAETLSKATLLERGYSIIYKIRGYLVNCSEKQERLVLSEQDYFVFSRRIDSLIPDYVANLLNRRGLWFVGSPPRNWEERLLIYAILEKRQSTQQKLAFAENADPFASIYLKKKGFEHHAVDLSELGNQLRSHLRTPL